MSRVSHVFRQVWFPLAIWVCFGALLAAQCIGLAPSTDAMVGDFLERLAANRLPWVFCASFIENIIGASLYFPGSVILMTAMAQTAGAPSDAVATYIAVYIAAVLAQHVNFFVGRSANLDSQTAARWNAARLWSACFATFWHPQLAAVTCYSLGTCHSLKYRQFMQPFIASSLTWSIFWALVIYNFGSWLATPHLFRWLVVVYLGIWTLRSIKIALRHSKK